MQSVTVIFQICRVLNNTGLTTANNNKRKAVILPRIKNTESEKLKIITSLVRPYSSIAEMQRAVLKILAKK